MNKEQEILEKTLDLLHQPGYRHQGGLHRKNMDGKVIGSCLMGCVFEASSAITYNEWVPSARVIKTLQDLAPSVRAGRNPIADFNDDPQTTLEDVILLVKQAIHQLDREECCKECKDYKWDGWRSQEPGRFGSYA